MGWTNTEKNVGTQECEGNHFLTAVLMPTIASRITGNFEPHNLFHSGGNWIIKNNTKPTRKDLISFIYFTCYVMLQINIPVFVLIERCAYIWWTYMKSM